MLGAYRLIRTYPVYIYAAVVFLLLSLTQPSSIGAQSAHDCTVYSPTVTSLEFDTLALINTYRQQNGATALVMIPSLMRAATWLDQDMIANKYVSHVDPLGRGPGSRMTDCGFQDIYTWRGENIAAGYETPAQVFAAWKASPGHNALMLDPVYRAIGIKRLNNSAATYNWYWTLDATSSLGGESPIMQATTPTIMSTSTNTIQPTSTPTSTRTSTVTMTPRPTNTPTVTVIPTSTGTPTETLTPTESTTPTTGIASETPTVIITIPNTWQTPQRHYPTLIPRPSFTPKPTWTQDIRRG